MSTKLKLPVVCVVDDERSIGRSLMRLFRKLDVSLEAFTNPLEAQAWLLQNPVDVLITDQRMPHMSGTELIEAVDACQADAVRFILSGYSDFEEITAAFNTGKIHKYISKPWNDEELLFSVTKALQETSTDSVQDNALEQEDTSIQSTRILGNDPSMVALFEKIRRMSTANVPVFIHGETGTGKELVARALHEESFRGDQPFIAVNCANFSSELMESQLFGHKKGAFTGAEKDHAGLIAAANGGTLFLDEVTTLPLNLQSKLLRVLQEREYSPLGSTAAVPFDAQVLSASSTTLASAVADGNFREDLRYRLEVLPLDIPPLRQRGRDALALFNHYLREVRQDTRFEYSGEFEHFLQSYDWPGNVRQLINMASYVATMTDKELLDLDCLPADVRDHYAGSRRQVNSGGPALTLVAGGNAATNTGDIKPLREFERQAIEHALSLCDDNIQKAAAMLEVSASTLYRKIQVWNAAESSA